ncbi:MAG: ATP-binding protein [Polyangiaceae bacterium]|jgi:signal transduction histidine kinase
MRKRTSQPAGQGEIGKFDALSDPAPVSDTELPSSRRRVPDVPTAWLDQLLVAAIDLPVSSGERSVLEATVNSVAAILPTYAVGICWVPDAGSGRRERVILRRWPEGTPESAHGVDAARIFPSFAHEYVTPLPAGSAGSSIHLASEEDDLDARSAPAAHLVDRAAIVLGRALSHARAAVGRQRSVRQFEKRMIQADKLATFGQLAAGVVHELNNPLTSIVAYSEYLMRKALEGAGMGDPGDIERLRRIGESANRMLRFTRELVSYTRPSSGVTETVILHEVMDQAIAFCEHVLAAAGLRAERRYAPETLLVRGVGEQLVQVFVNLLTNACQAAPQAGGRVVLTTSQRESDAGRRVAVLVADDGAGIAPEHLPHVFVPFFTTKRDRNGTGLGLSIVKSIVDAHDGDIRVQSQLGRGTEFAIDLPADPAIL